MSSRIVAWLSERFRGAAPRPAAPPVPADVVRLSDVLVALRKTEGRLSESELAALGVSVARLLAASPERHLRWTAPTQLLFARDASVRVLFSGEPRFGVEDASEVSQRWLSPQLIRGEAPSVQSDLFTLASLLFVAATLRAPFEGESDWHTRTAITDQTLGATLSSLRPDLSERFLTVMARAHQHGPPGFSTMNEFVLAMQPLAIDGSAVVARLFEVAAPKRPGGPAVPDVGDAEARLVEADRLEERGLRDQATWLRRGLDGQPHLSVKELEALRKKLSLEFVASVDDCAIHGCDLAFGAACPGRWRNLARTTSPLRRSCGTCGAEVTYTDSRWEFLQRGRRLAVDLAVLGEGETLSEGPFIGSRTPEKVVRDEFD